MSERHTYVTKGISREVFREKGVKLTVEDPDLVYYVHDHSYVPFSGPPACTARCEVIRSGEVTMVTRTEDVQPRNGV